MMHENLRRFRKFAGLAASILVAISATSVDAGTGAVENDRYTFALSGLSVPKQVKELKVSEVHEYAQDGSDVSVSYEQPDKGFKLTIYVYKSPEGTTGPTLMLDANGKEIQEDREDEIKQHHAVLKLTTPSESFQQEYKNTLYAIGAIKFMANVKLTDEIRFKAVPERKDSPIAYGAELSGSRELKDGIAIPWTWKTYLYTIPGYFVKIHCTYPSQLWMDFPDVEFIQSINWDKFCAPVKKEQP